MQAWASPALTSSLAGCSADTYLDVLVVCTLVPLVVSLLFYLPVLLLRIKKITGLRRKRVEDRFWFLQNFW